MALELARHDMDDSLAEGIERALIQMETLIAQYLDYTGCSVKESAARIDIAAAIREIVQTYQCADVIVNVAVSPAYLPQRALTRCAQNLLDNALKHSGSAPVGIDFYQADSSYILEIADRGPGIPEAERNNVFQPFLRLDNSRSQLGSGLGLTIVLEICRVQDWTIDLVPRPGGGLIARLNMPVPEDDEARAPDAPIVEANGA